MVEVANREDTGCVTRVLITPTAVVVADLPTFTGSACDVTGFTKGKVMLQSRRACRWLPRAVQVAHVQIQKWELRQERRRPGHADVDRGNVGSASRRRRRRAYVGGGRAEIGDKRQEEEDVKPWGWESKLGFSG